MHIICQLCASEMPATIDALYLLHLYMLITADCHNALIINIIQCPLITAKV